jgi:hypothetical protein
LLFAPKYNCCKTASTSLLHALENKRRTDNVSLTVEDCEGGILFHWSITSPHHTHPPSEEDPSAVAAITLLTTPLSKEFCVPKHDDHLYKSNNIHFADITHYEHTEKNDDDTVVTWSIFDLSSSEEEKAVPAFVTRTRCSQQDESTTVVYGNCHGTINKAHEKNVPLDRVVSIKNHISSPTPISTPPPTPTSNSNTYKWMTRDKGPHNAHHIDYDSVNVYESDNPLPGMLPEDGNILEADEEALVFKENKEIAEDGSVRKLYSFYTTYSCSCYTCSCGKGCSTSCCSTCYSYWDYCAAGRYYPNGYISSGSTCYACPAGRYQPNTGQSSCMTCPAVT